MSAEEIGIIVLLILVVVGPQRLPQYAEQLAKLVRNVRQMATGATQTIREELGDDIADLDLSKFDPRQYDPRRIVREALLEDIVPATKPARPKAAARAKPVSSGGPAEVTAAAAAVATSPTEVAAADAPATSTDAPVAVPASAAAEPSSDVTPFDDEAT